MKRLVVIAIPILLVAVMAAWLAVLTVDGDPVATRIDDLRPSAELGDVEAQFAMATLLWSDAQQAGEIREAANWYQKAATKGHAAAQFQLGSMYEHGQGVRRDYAKAAEWYRRAAEFGAYPAAQFALGQLFFYGRGVPHDYAEAIVWHRRAAERGHAAAQVLMGAMYEEGWGIRRDLVEAYVWYTLAIRNGSGNTVSGDYDPVTARAALIVKMNKVQIGQAERMADNRLPRG